MNQKLNTMEGQSKEVNFDMEREGHLSMPLMMGQECQPVYRAYKVRDLEALVKQLPCIMKGEAAWLRKLRTLTEGEEMAIGDFRENNLGPKIHTQGILRKMSVDVTDRYTSRSGRRTQGVVPHSGAGRSTRTSESCLRDYMGNLE